MLPVIEAFMAAHGLPDVTVVADAGMVSEANQTERAMKGVSDVRYLRSRRDRSAIYLMRFLPVRQSR